ncbi:MULTISPECIES: xanthine dehydrogenase family protein molybdopterin-binding subunit [Halomonadaceae]|jgi:isoquinoline 1-oxidoreductase subunit beta|uniref:xanthine dehydrogenase family protein molybdopterin-binding subunit n=1 Tax=Halomonadaceae TaxID=28256 RepID=UPI0012F331AE|nr:MULTISPECIES: molybdopterin cofactor-binding domain-containing protein [Halomonas]CAD5275429.1 putative oxidoreductase, molybdenum cofactor binding subunit [Halomonas sp. 156]CAD5276512.1 putative oxidoreductase, molybdenum cofactor binding subunit [Halomonas sp. 113]CAD5277991.1 putative oxidoreductase, molybdenum cofactor binding subunit [Halomonas sp. 59]CAD5283592.1 Isoquinoline 1-oxidoreductase beta subunit [Halomonas sp. I3]VXC03455.1 putative oxidoreductase, molybdenum cofactor bindi
MKTHHLSFSRRAFLGGTLVAGAALIIPLRLPTAWAREEEDSLFSHAYIRIDTNGQVTFLLPTSEMGQGTHTGQAQILAEELGADWSSITVGMPNQLSDDYRIPFIGQMRSVGSFGIRFWHGPLRRAAAQARQMLTQAAAERLDVAAAALHAENGFIVHADSGRRIPFGDLVEDAMALPMPEDPTFRPDSERTLTGRKVARLDTPAKVTGKAVYGIDVEREGMLYGAVRLAPVFSADVETFDESSVSGMPGVVAVVSVPRGMVVVADSWWQAKQAADTLDITFTRTPADTLSTDEINAMLREGLDRTDAPVTTLRGEAEATLSDDGQVVEAEYSVPLLTHASMEPINCTAESTEERTELWIGTQGQDVVRMTLENAMQIPADRFFINTTYLGGGFGRKTHGEIALQAALASRAVDGRPVKVLWAREDDVQQGQYRQTMMCRFRAVLNEAGQITGMRIRVSGPQMGREYGIDPEQRAQSTGNLANFDPFSLGGLSDMRYVIPNFVVDHAVVDLPIPLCPWRSIAHSFNGFFFESFMDECAAAADRDPLEFRRSHCTDQARMLAVLDRVAEISHWQEPAAKGISRGFAVVESYGSYVAQVVEARADDEGIQVERVYAAIDCGRAINPGQVEAQIQGAVIDALGAAMRQKVTIRDGHAEQSNFHDYPLLRIGEAPAVTVSIVDIGSPLGGVGEPGIPPLAPALANALFAATQQRIRHLPLSDHVQG